MDKSWSNRAAAVVTVAVGVGLLLAACGGGTRTASVEVGSAAVGDSAVVADPSLTPGDAVAGTPDTQSGAVDTQSGAVPGDSNPQVTGAGLGPAAAPAPAGGNGGATDQGVTANSIALGNIQMYGMALANVLTRPQQQGNHATIDAINDAGGVYGRKFRLYDCDSGVGSQADSDTCLTKLVEQNKIFALLTGVDWGSAGNHNLLRKYNIPYVGSWAYSNSEWTDPFMFPTHMSMLHEAAANANWVRQVIKPTTYGLICLNSPEMQAACQNVRKVLDPTGAKMVKQINVDISAADLSSEVLNMKLANPEHIIHYVINPATMVKWMVASAAQGYYPPKGISGNHLAAEALGSLFGQHPVNRYWTNTTYKLWGSQFMGTMAKYAPGNHGIEHHIVQAGYVAGNMLAQAAKKVGPDLTREKLMAVLGQGEWYADPDLGQKFMYSTNALGRGLHTGTGQCTEYMYKYTDTNTVSSTGSPQGFTPDDKLFVITNPLPENCPR